MLAGRDVGGLDSGGRDVRSGATWRVAADRWACLVAAEGGGGGTLSGAREVRTVREERLGGLNLGSPVLLPGAEGMK